jgi:hypothetical protein
MDSISKHLEVRVIYYEISIEDPHALFHASRPRGARTREIHRFLQISYSTLRRTSHHSGGPRNFDTLDFLALAARSHARGCFYRTRKTQRVWDLCNVF